VGQRDQKAREITLRINATNEDRTIALDSDDDTPVASFEALQDDGLRNTQLIYVNRIIITT